MNLTLFTDPVTYSPRPTTFLGDKVAPELLAPLRKRYEQILAPICPQMEVAGSVRRARPLVHDLEYVLVESEPGAIRHTLFSHCLERQLDPDFYFINRRGDRLIKLREALPSGQEIHVEFYISRPEYFGYTLMLRTGSAKWNKAWMFYLKHIMHCEIRDNRIYTGPHTITTFQSEDEFFAFLGIQNIEPCLRNKEHDFKLALVNAGLYNLHTRQYTARHG